MKQEINPKDTGRAQAFEMWMQSPMPMVTLVKTFDVTHLYKVSKRRGLKFNMLLCWCIGKAASQMDEFHLLPEQGKLFRYDRLAINVIVNNSKGGISTCDIPFSDDLMQFCHEYDALTQKAAETCSDITNEEAMIVGTSAMVETELDCIVNQYSGIFNNPFLAWGRYKHGWFKTTLPISFQFHHAQMDGGHAAQFLEELQRRIQE
ncbi:MAG: CatA-like O-acetyltransferase, family 2 [Bacteroidales bacterium]|nr:CatA-like O-acetyltransferase, family 2 [Bacteroidales bacterium]